ncbi:MAG TPA: isoaspartyl peptidase/L-asparaginase [Steroidobacteraceae bacterium]|nr:isoaspartyl peptidase/L-asparaginase [Steroidobacteraceae bacterium]
MLAIAIHGGAGSLPRTEMKPEAEAEYLAELATALDSGFEQLAKGGSSLDAVVAAVKLLENSPLFNAGRGAVFTHDGVNELDAAIMDGSNLKAGAVAGLRHVRNPIELARRVMERSPHVMVIGDGAEEFALEQGLELVPRDYFHTQRRWRQLEIARRAGDAASESINYFGTVGAVALDGAGNLAAATSTGGMTNKKYGRVGDSPIIGAGTYANNSTCALSATGHGEYFMRAVVGHDVSALMEYRGLKLAEAVRTVVQEKLVRMGGEGGVIAVDRAGGLALEFNCEGMFRGSRTSTGARSIAIYGAGVG